MAEDKKNRRDPLNDELNRCPFAKSIAALIKDIAEDKPALIQDGDKGGFTIGIEGEWGEGKTHTIKLIKEEIETYNENKEKPIEWMVFNPWHFTDRQHLASLFLRDLAVFIEERSKSRLRLWVEKNFLKIGRSLVLIVRFFLTLVCPDTAKLLRDYSEILQDSKENRSPKTLETLKDDIKKKLNSNLPFSHIVVAVEDMDRLNPEEIRAMLQLMKMIADFPKITYLLGYDRTHVVNALGDLAGHHSTTEEAREYGEGYLKKVVQAAHKLPAPPEDAIADLTLTQFKKIAKEFHRADFDQQEYFEHAWFYLKRLMPTLRMGERIVNRSASLILMLRDKCNPADVLVAAYLMQDQSKFWKWLGENYTFVLRDFHRFIRHEPPTDKPKAGYIDEQINGDDNKTKDTVMELIKVVLSLSNPDRSTPSPVFDFRMGDPNFTQMYFRYEHTPAVEVPAIVQALWQTTNAHEREEGLKKLQLYPTLLPLVLKSLKEKNNNSPMNWQKQALPLLTDLGTDFDQAEHNDVLLLMDYMIIFINSQPEVQRADKLTDLIVRWLDNGAQYTPLQMFIAAIEKKRSDFPQLSPDQEDRIRKKIENKIEPEWLANNATKLFNHKHAKWTLCIWLELDPERARKKLDEWVRDRDRDRDPFMLCGLLNTTLIDKSTIDIGFAKKFTGLDLADLKTKMYVADSVAHIREKYQNVIDVIRALPNDSPHA
ncbi:MAG: P-loop NTPase fold protein [Holosporales bacterium]